MDVTGVDSLVLTQSGNSQLLSLFNTSRLTQSFFITNNYLSNCHSSKYSGEMCFFLVMIDGLLYSTVLRYHFDSFLQQGFDNIHILVIAICH